MKKIFAFMIIFSVIMISGCGDIYKADGSILIDDHSDDHSKNTEGQVAVSTDVNPVVDITNDKSTNNTTNNVSEVSVKDSDEFKQLENECNQLKEKNSELENQINELKAKSDTIPVIEYKNLGLSINGENIPINKSDSMVTIDGNIYYSKELAESFLNGNNEITIENETLYVGKIVSEKADLFDKHINDKLNCYLYDAKTDSYGNMRSNALYFDSNKSHNIIFALNREYSFLKFTISMDEYASTGRMGNLIIKADNEIVYSFEGLNKQMEPFETQDIYINNCLLLTIEYNSDYNNECMISDAIIYN